MLKFHGLPFSAHTRKVIIAALEKGLPYELQPVVPVAAPGTPGAPPAHWRDWSPLGKIPVLQDGPVTLADSSVIALYLERVQPGASGQASPVEFACLLLHREREYRSMYPSSWRPDRLPAADDDGPFAPYGLTHDAAAIAATVRITWGTGDASAPSLREDLFGLKTMPSTGCAMRFVRRRRTRSATSSRRGRCGFR